MASVFVLLRSLNKRIVYVCILALIVIYSLVDTGPTQQSQFPMSSDPAPFAQSSCDPKDYPQGSFLQKALTPPLDIPGVGPVWASENYRQFKDLCTCLQQNSCAENQDKVVILGSNHFIGWYSDTKEGSTGGETVWAVAAGNALKKLKYTYLYGGEVAELTEMNSILSSRVRGIILNDNVVFECFEDTKTCVKSRENPGGIPIWKVFTFHFWADANHPLGPKWTLAPEDYKSVFGDKGNTYLGYSVEPSCLTQEFIPHADRPRGQVYAMAKRLSYFAAQPDRAWPPSFYTMARKKVQTPGGLHFVIGAANDTDFANQYGVTIPHLPAEDVHNLGLLDRTRFMAEVAKSRVLVGVGRPALSPTPYQALCLGVPFINPILSWDRENPRDRKQWMTQHNGLRYLEPPYVYNVFKDDQAGFINAVRKGLENPINRYILPRSTMDAVAGRLDEILKTDWKQEAEVILAERIRTKQGTRFLI